MSMSNLSILVIVVKFGHAKCMYGADKFFFLLLAVRTSTVATASKKVSVVNSIHNMPLWSLR